MTVIAGVDIGNATTEVVLTSGGKILAAARVPTRGRKGSADSLRGAAALVRRVERQAGCTIAEARIAPLRAVDTAVVTVPDTVPLRGRLRVLAAGVATPGGTGACVGPPLPLAGPGGRSSGPSRLVPPAAAGGKDSSAGSPLVAVLPPGLRYDEAAARLRDLLAAGTPIGAVLVAGDEGVLVANRLPGDLPVIDQVDAAAAAACQLLAVEVRPPGHTLSLLTDPVALGARLGLADHEAEDAVALGRALADHPNAVVGLLPVPAGAMEPAPAGAMEPAEPAPSEPWVRTADGGRLALRDACARLPGWPVGAVRAFGTGAAESEVDDLFAVDLAAAAEAATARQGSTGRAVLVASLSRAVGPQAASPADLLGDLLTVPVRSPASEPAAARRGALTTPGARPQAVVVDLGAGTIDVISADSDVVAAGAGDLLTAAVAETLGIPRAAADWVKRGPCLRVDGGQRFEAEDGSRGFLTVVAPTSAVGMLAVEGPGGLLPFDRRHGPGEWRAIRIRLKLAVLAANFQRAVRTLGPDLSQVLIVGGPAGDEELLSIISRSLPGGVAVGRGDVGGTCEGDSLGHRYAVALGLTLDP
ncbi:MAG TPA: diol dehydratase reactivase ATPase-like domain-containing protein [Streptosporangiaceae bacterium]|nr:diol dehydratase reactivase ATPase-like domain-containing protein [Streptosporangiaceae bacterium]